MKALRAVNTRHVSQSPSAEALRLGLASAQAGVWEWFVSTGENHWSPTLWELYGLPEDAPASFESWTRCLHPDDAVSTISAVQQASQAWAPFDVEWRTHPDLGPVRWLMARGRPAEEPGAPRYVGIVLDVTSRKHAEEEVHRLNSSLEARVQERAAAVLEHERLLKTILDGIPGLVGYWTQERRNRFANRPYAEWFDCEPEKLQGTHITELLGPQLYALNRPYIDAVLQGKRQCFERRLPIPNHPGQYRDVESHYIPDIDELGQVRGFLVMVFDVTQAKAAELAAEAANQAKSDFLANISHEVRTPLNAMFGLAQIGARQATQLVSRRTFEQILDAAQHLLTLVNDVLDFSKIEAGRLTLLQEPVNLAQVLDHVLLLKAIRAHAKGLTLRVIEGPTVPLELESDSTRLAQILLNLLSNAIHYTDRGEVTMRLQSDDDCLLIDVIDTGIGMTPQQLEQIFKPFVQVHGRARAGGSGLGLVITRRIVSLMGGEIAMHSEAGQGTRVSLRLPLRHAKPMPACDLRRIYLIGMPHETAELLTQSLQLRGLDVQNLAQWPEQDLAAGSLVVTGPSAVMDIDNVMQAREQGCLILVNSEAGTAPPLPEALQHEVLWLSGPLTPLRMHHAVSRQRTQAQSVRGMRLRGVRVMAAEDNPVNRLVLGQMLEQEGAEVFFAEDGNLAIELVRAQGATAFDVVLCDIEMPDLDGYATTQALHRLAPDLPVIGLTAHAFAAARQRGKMAGMVDYITKPYMLDTLVAAILQHTRRPVGPALPTMLHMTSSAQVADISMGVCAAPNVAQADFQAMRDHFKSEPLLLDRLIGMLGRTLHDIDLELERALAGRNIELLARTAHNIKGTALNLHTPDLTRLAIQAQDSARAKSTTSWEHGETLQVQLRQFLTLVQSQGA